MANVKNYALVTGVCLLVIGALALIPAFSGLSFGLPILRIETSYGLFLGIFPFNIVNKFLFIGFGLWGIASASDPVLSLPRSTVFARGMFLISLVEVILGIIPQTNTFFGYIPLFGAGIWLNAVIALASGIFGYGVARKTAGQH